VKRTVMILAAIAITGAIGSVANAQTPGRWARFNRHFRMHSGMTGGGATASIPAYSPSYTNYAPSSTTYSRNYARYSAQYTRNYATWQKYQRTHPLQAQQLAASQAMANGPGYASNSPGLADYLGAYMPDYLGGNSGGGQGFQPPPGGMVDPVGPQLGGGNVGYFQGAPPCHGGAGGGGYGNSTYGNSPYGNMAYPPAGNNGRFYRRSRAASQFGSNPWQANNRSYFDRRGPSGARALRAGGTGGWMPHRYQSASRGWRWNHNH
jgi:hypothetical protein